MSPRMQAARDAAKAALQQAIAALDRAQTDEDVQLVLDVIENYRTSHLTTLVGVEEQLSVSAERLARLVRRDLPVLTLPPPATPKLEPPPLVVPAVFPERRMSRNEASKRGKP